MPVDEHKKAIFAGARIKSFDFIVYPAGRNPWLVDVKGRKFPYEIKGGRRYWENWVTRDDIDGMGRWSKVFGDGFEPGLMFAYWLLGPAGREPHTCIHQYRGEHYAFLWAPLSEYESRVRSRSPKWNTVTVSSREFREIVRPLAGEEANSCYDQPEEAS